jgi:hypothetical protein
LPQEIDASFPTFAWCTDEQTGALQDFELSVDRAHPRRIPQLLSKILDADNSVAVRNRGADLDAVLRTSEQRAGFFPQRDTTPSV